MLKRSRKDLNGKFTRFITYINNTLNRNNFNKNRLLLLNVENATNEFESIQMKIDILINTTETGTV